MSSPDYGEISKPQTPEEILRSTSLRFSELEREATEALYEKLDPQGYRMKLQERAELILTLPAKIKESAKSGGSFPDSEWENICSFAYEARIALSSKGIFSLRVLLIPQGSVVGDPNEIERLINRIYPTKQEQA